jgi:methylated-DNA-[protein]-cysteine S-methyltransferase
MGILWIVGMDVVAYEVPAWGVGELYFRAGKLLYHELPRAGSSPAAGVEHPLAERVQAYFRRERVSFDDVEVEAEWGTPFQEALADALRSIPWGEVVTYGELAALAGRPRAPRAAGTFCAENNFPLVVPCHRVVSSSGLGSYGSLGVEYKRRLLALEGVDL